MDIANGWALALGGVALAAPLAIHILTRPRPIRVPLSTLKFVREVLAERRAAHRLRDFAILALRTLAIALFALALARPIGQASLLSDGNSAVSTVRVVILDVSQSMGATQHGIRALERARPLAADHLKYRSGMKSNLILAGARPVAVFPQASTNFSALTEELNRSVVRPERLDAKGAIRQASDMLAAGPADAVKELVLVSDFQRTNWESADFADLPTDTKILFESVAPEIPPPNLAILGVTCRTEGAVDRAGRLEVEAGNFTRAAQRVQATVTIGSAVYRLEGLCPAGGRVTMSQTIPLSGVGWQAGEARLTGADDSLAADDVRPFVVEVRPPPTFVLLSRQPAALTPNSSYFMERAILPSASESAGRTRLLRFDPSSSEREELSHADLLILDHPGKLSPELVRTINSLVRRGRALLYVVSEPMDAVNLKRLAEEAGSSLQLPVEFIPAPPERGRRERFLTDVAERRAPFSTFGDTIGAALRPLRFSGGLDSRAVEGGLKDDVLARYSDGSAALLTTGWGSGVAAVLNIDLPSSNLPTSPAFVPLIGELINQLLVQRGAATIAAPGESFSAYLPGSAPPVAELTLAALGPVGQAVDVANAGRLLDEGTGIQWRMDAAPPPGVYEVRAAKKSQAEGAVFATAVALPAEESDLRPLASSVLIDRLSGGRQAQFRSASAGPRESDHLWVWLAGGCVVCMLGELLALRLFRT